MNDTLKRCLDDLEARLDPQEEDAILQAWRDFSEDRFRGDIFSPRRSRPNPPKVEWPHVSINTALGDFDQMALQQFGGCSQTLADAGGAVLNVRCNYGSSIAPLLFGVEVFVMDEELETLPTSRPLNDKAAIRRLIDAGVPDLSTGYGAQRHGDGRAATPRSPGNTPRSASTSSSTTPTCRGRWTSARWCGAARSSTPRWTSRRW